MTSVLCEKPAAFIDEAKIEELLEDAKNYQSRRVRAALAKARELKGLDALEIAALMEVDDPVLLEELFAIARWVKQEIYGNRLVLFAPLCISNLCNSECICCPSHTRKTALKRNALMQEEIANEVKALIDQGHKRVLLMAGESSSKEEFNYILRAIDTIYRTKSVRGEIRRVNVNMAPLALEQFKELKAANIGAYQFFQETYHRQTHADLQSGGAKRDFNWRLSAMDRAMAAGIENVGIGVLFGLYDWKFELLALLQHVRHLEEKFGAGPHTITVSRLEPLPGPETACRPPHMLTDADFKKIIAILRLAVPYTGIIMPTPENIETRRATFALGVSQIFPGRRCNRDGYEHSANGRYSLDEIVRDITSLGYTPSLCTACHRLRRTGADFMDFAKRGLIKHHCEANALSSCMEYLLDYATPETRQMGEKLLDHSLKFMEPSIGKIASGLVTRVRANQRDVFV
jgi:2-iminoacetate synthase